MKKWNVIFFDTLEEANAFSQNRFGVEPYLTQYIAFVHDLLSPGDPGYDDIVEIDDINPNYPDPYAGWTPGGN